MVFRRISVMALIALFVLMLAMSCYGAGITKETDIWSWSTSANKWERLTKGYLKATTTSNTIAVGGGYGSTGVSISAAGVYQGNGAMTVDGLFHGDGGIAVGTKTTISTAGQIVTTPTSTTGVAVFVDGATQTSGDVLKLRTIAGTLDGGNFINCVDNATSKFSVAEGGNTLIAGTLGVTGATTQTGEWQAGGGYGSSGVTVTTAGAISADGAIVGLKNIPTAIAANATLSLASYPSGSFIVCSGAAPEITLPAVATSAGVTWTIFAKGKTTFKLIAASACLLCPTLDAKTSLTWTTSTNFNMSITVTSDGTNWFVTGWSIAPGASA